MLMETVFNSQKFRDLVLHIAQRSKDDPRFGATKLNKLLFYMDFGSYRLLGTPITGATYQHLSDGPAPRQLLVEKDILIDSGDATAVEREYFLGTQKRIVAQRDPDLSLFSGAELQIVEDVLTKFWDYNASRISAYSHQEWGWRVTGENEHIPYQAAWVSSDPLTPEQITLGREIAARAGLMSA